MLHRLAHVHHQAEISTQRLQHRFCKIRNVKCVCLIFNKENDLKRRRHLLFGVRFENFAHGNVHFDLEEDFLRTLFFCCCVRFVFKYVCVLIPYLILDTNGDLLRHAFFFLILNFENLYNGPQFSIISNPEGFSCDDDV